MLVCIHYSNLIRPLCFFIQFQGNASLLNKITTGEDFDFLSKRAQSLEVSCPVALCTGIFQLFNPGIFVTSQPTSCT